MKPAVDERRSHPRSRSQRPCKLLDPRSRKYHGGRTVDVARGGALIEFNKPLPLDVGQTLFIDIIGDAAHGLIRAEDMHEATVVRVHLTEGRETRLAVAYAQPIEPADAKAS
jgi:hypothetical protein